MNPAPKLQPAFYGGLVIGVLSALPIISIGNCCCCLWVVSGGILAAWIMQANYPAPVTIGDGALVGLLAGVIGAVVMLVLSIPIAAMVGPFQERLVEGLLERSADLPPAMRDMFENARGQQGAFGHAAGFLLFLFVGSIFSTLGGMLGTLIFRKPPPAAVAPPPYPGADGQVPPLG